MISKIDKNSVRKARHFRNRRNISGPPARPRLNGHRSLHNVKEVVFDRGGYLYTGRVAQVAEGARKAGLEF